jgi:hypothetical protein
MKRWLRISYWAVAGPTEFAIVTFAAFVWLLPVPSRTYQKIGGRWSSATEPSLQPSLEESRNISCAAACSCERLWLKTMPKSLFATFASNDTFSQHSYGEVAAKFLAALEAVSDCLCRAVNTNRHSIEFRIDDSLRESLAK